MTIKDDFIHLGGPHISAYLFSRRTFPFMAGRILIAMIIPVILLILIVSSITGTDRFDLFPSPGVQITPFSDSDQNGTSTVDSFSSGNGVIVFKYTLRKSAHAPYAGLTFKKSTPIDLTRYDRIMLRIRSTASSVLKIVVYARVEGITSQSRPMSYAYLTEAITVPQDGDDCELNLSDLKIPDWWYTLNNLKLYDKRVKIDLSSVDRLTVENGEMNGADLADAVSISGITFVKSPRAIPAVCIFLLAGYLAAIAILRKRIFSRTGIRREEKENVPPHRSIEISDTTRDETARLTSYLRDNFADPDVSLGNAAARTGIPAFRISKITRNNYGMTFPRYITCMRMDEAKRLLRETDVKIIEIAFSVGFGTVSHFNKIFKIHEGISPREFRTHYRDDKTD